MKFISLLFEIMVISRLSMADIMRNAEGTGNTARSWFNLPSV